MSNIANKLLRLNQVKTDFQTVFTNNGINFSGQTFEDYPSIVEANIGAGPLVIKDTNEDIFERKIILETDDPDFPDYNVSGWNLDNSISSNNFYVQNAIMKYGKRPIIGESYGGSINSIIVDDDNTVYAGGVTTRRVRRFTKFDLTYVFGEQSIVFPNTIQSMIMIPNVNQIFLWYINGFALVNSATTNLSVILQESPSMFSQTNAGADFDSDILNTPNNKTVLFVGVASEIYPYSLDEGEANPLGNPLLFNVAGQAIFNLYFLENPKRILRVATNGDIRIRELSYVGSQVTLSGNFVLPSYPSVMDDTALVDDRLYVTGLAGTYVYDITNLTLVGIMPDYGARPRAVEANSTHVFVGGEDNNVKKYKKDTFELVGVSDDYNGTIRTIKFKNDKLYYGGTVTQRPVKILDAHRLIGDEV